MKLGKSPRHIFRYFVWDNLHNPVRSSIRVSVSISIREKLHLTIEEEVGNFTQNLLPGKMPITGKLVVDFLPK